MTKRIPLHDRAGAIRAFALVDDEDFEQLNQWRWHLTGRGYAARSVKDGATRYAIRMHRAILGLPSTDRRLGEHENRNPLDNRRSNLRVVDGNGPNLQNLAPRKGRQQGQRGTYFDRRAGKWAAQVRLNGVKHYLGLHESQEAAAQVASEFRRSHMPYSTDDRTKRV